MYRQYFGLAESPFSLAPDPRFLYLSQRHQEALAHLLYGMSGDGGFVLLTGEIGSGKTTVCRRLLEQVPENCDVAYIFNPRLTAAELLASLCDEIGIALPEGARSIKTYVDAINTHLLAAHAAGRNTVLIIDEAQNLAADVLEQMRLLTNLETDCRKLLQIVLIGQPELASLLARPELRQLSQRIVARYHLDPLSKAEVAAYVGHRLQVAGASAALIPAPLIGRLYRLSGGVPRLINLLCDRALLGAYAQGKSHVDGATLAQAAREVLPGQRRPWPLSVLRAGRGRWPGSGKGLGALAALAVVVLTLAGAAALWSRQPPATVAPPPEAASTPAAAPAPLAEALVSPLAAGPGSATREAAYAALFQTWGLGYRPGPEACRQARTAGLRCFNGHGKIETLRAQGLPAVLTLRAADGSRFYATLTALGSASADFSLGGQVQRVALNALQRQWTGQYTLLWRRPAAVRGDIQPGERGTAVHWLATRLAAWQGKALAAGQEAVFDDELRQQLKQFQRTQGIAADGTVGAQTLMRLAAPGDGKQPGLTAPAGEAMAVASAGQKPGLALKVSPVLESLHNGRR